MKKYGSKDVMRMESLRDKSRGDYIQQIIHAFNMSSAITEPGKAMARGYAAQAVFGEQAAIAQVFFERAYDLSGGREVRAVASVNALDNSEEGIEAEYNNIPIEEQPASRGTNVIKFQQSKHQKSKITSLGAYGKVNTIKGSGPQINLYGNTGTIEVWKTDTDKYRLTYTSHYDPIYGIGATKQFSVDGKIIELECIDYIDVKYISNLAPLYGKSIMIYCYN